MIRRGADPAAVKTALPARLRVRGAEYAAAHDVGHVRKGAPRRRSAGDRSSRTAA